MIDITVAICFMLWVITQPVQRNLILLFKFKRQKKKKSFHSTYIYHCGLKCQGNDTSFDIRKFYFLLLISIKLQGKSFYLHSTTLALYIHAETKLFFQLCQFTWGEQTSQNLQRRNRFTWQMELAIEKNPFAYTSSLLFTSNIRPPYADSLIITC